MQVLLKVYMNPEKVKFILAKVLHIILKKYYLSSDAETILKAYYNTFDDGGYNYINTSSLKKIFK